MKLKLVNLWKNLDKDITVHQRELILGIASCILSGMLVGLFFSPRKNVRIGCNNGNNIGASEDFLEEDDAEI